MRICTRCKVKKELGQFHKAKKEKLGIREVCKACRKIQYLERRNYILLKAKERSQTEEFKSRVNAYQKNRRKEDVNFRLAGNLRTRLNRAIEIDQKDGSAIDDLGCSIGQFRLYIENYFPLYPGMNWNNYGQAWELDHFLPLSKFDLSDRNELLEACHYTNIQPLWIEDNKVKRDNLPCQ